jgi:hypothetical protein
VPRELVEELLWKMAAHEVVLQRGAELFALHRAIVLAALVLEHGDDLDVFGVALGLQKS